MPWSCTVFGHAYAFDHDGPTLRWTCRRCGTPGGTKTYDTTEAAARYAAAFEARPSGGNRMTPLSLLPLRLIRRGKR